MRLFLNTLLAALICGAASRGLARPLALDLDVPALACPLLFGQAQAVPFTPQPAVSAPPVVLQPGPPQQGPEAVAAAPGADTLRLKDGRTLQGKILYQVQTGLLFRDSVSQQTYVVPFGDIVDLQQGKLAFPATTGALVPDKRLFLEAQIREVKGRYDSLSLWPAIEELVGGAIGVASGVLFALLLPDTLDYVLGALIGATGVVSLVVGVFEMASVVRRENELQEQLDQLKAQLGQLKAEAVPARSQPVVAFSF